MIKFDVNEKSREVVIQDGNEQRRVACQITDRRALEETARSCSTPQEFAERVSRIGSATE